MTTTHQEVPRSLPRPASDGLAPSRPATPRRVDPLAARLRAQLDELATTEREVRAGGEDAVHRMRVSVRRLRSCLHSFRSEFLDGSTRHLEEELRWLGESLGAARDVEVVYACLRDAVASLPPQHMLGTVPPTIAARREAELAAARAALSEALDSARYSALWRELAEFASAPPLRSGRPAKRLRRDLRNALRRVRRRVKAVAGLSGEARDDALHEVRKAVKHVRYGAETLRPAGPMKGLGHLAACFEELQEILGDHHDSVVAGEVLHDLAVTGARGGADGFTLGLAFAQQRSLAAEADREFSRAWRRARRAPAYRRLTG